MIHFLNKKIPSPYEWIKILFQLPQMRGEVLHWEPIPMGAAPQDLERFFLKPSRCTAPVGRGVIWCCSYSHMLTESQWPHNKAGGVIGIGSAHSGFMLVEALIGIAIGAVFVVTLVSLVIQSSAIVETGQARLSGELYTKEGIEALRDLEQSNPSAIFSGACTAPSICYPRSTSGAWQLLAGTEMLGGGYNRMLHFEDVYRDTSVASRPIVASGTPGATLDTQTKKALVSTLWQDRGSARITEYEIYVYQF